eukprot:403337291
MTYKRFQASQKDKEKIEQTRLRNRVGGFQKYVDSANLNNPDPISTHFVNEAERFDKDFAVVDKQIRESTYDVKLGKLNNLRQERFQREQNRWDFMEKKEQFDHTRIQVKADVFQAGKKNKGGAAYNIVNQDYEANKDGQKLKQIDNDARVRAMMRSKNLEHKMNTGYNILTGETRQFIQLPHHEKYNPIKSAGSQMLMNGPPRSSASQVGGVLPGMNY